MITPADIPEYGVLGFAVGSFIALARIFLKALDRRDDHIDHLVDKHDTQQRYIAEKSEGSFSKLSDAINDLTKEIARKKD